MPNYNLQLQSNNTDLQTVLQTLQTKAAGGEQATPVISVNTSGLITATAGIKTSIHQLAFQPAKIITPSTASQIAVSSGYYTGGNITVAGDSNLVASNIKSGVSIFGVSGTLEEGSGESGEQVEWSENEDAIVTKTLSAYFNDRVKTIGSYTFTQCSSLTTVSFPACTTIGSYAFASCIRLKTVSSPVCATIGNDAFLSCRSLATVSFPACTTIGSYAFSNCSRLATVSFPVCTTIGSTAFAQCRSLTTVSFPACTTISSYAFSSCSSLTTVSFPVCTTIGGNVFAGCSSLTTVSFPVCTTISSYAFARCSSLKTVNFPACTTIGGNAFASCRLLSQLYLGASSVCTLSNSNAFYSTPYTGYSSFFLGTPYIYVPSSLVDAYKSATNWTYFSSYISGI